MAIELLGCFHQSKQLGRVWNLSTSQLYAVLKRLEVRGEIVGKEILSDDAPTRTEYRLTEQGKSRLDSWLHYPQPSASIRRVRVEFLSRLYVARKLNFSTEAVVVAQRQACEQKRQALIAERQNASPGIDLLAIEFEISQLDAVLDWIERCELVPAHNNES